MIPYVSWTSFQLGPLTIQVWGMFVALGILAATLLAAARAARRGIERFHIVRLAVWVTVAGVVGARLFFLFPTPEAWSLAQAIRVRDGGMAITGGILAGAIAAAWYVRRRRLSLPQVADVVGPPLLLGEGIGRLGCFAIHDHLGNPTAFPLAVNVLGTPRHDVGLLLSIAGFLGWLLLSGVDRRRWLPLGGVGLVALLWYSLTRLTLDFLRATELPAAVGFAVDARYAGLTVAQYAAILGTLAAVLGLFRLLARSRSVARRVGE